MTKGKVNRRITELYEAAVLSPLSITVINLNFIRLDSVTSQHLAQVFPFCPNVTTLKLWKCNLGAKGVDFLSKTMKELVQLQVLVLDDNALGIEGAESLADCIPRLENLRKLYCRSNGLQCEGVRILTERLGCLNKLTVLTLDDNDMTSYGLEHLLYNLNLSRLERLGLSYDRITDCGVQGLIKSAGRLRNLEILDFKGNFPSGSVAANLVRTFPDVKIQ